MNFSVKSIDLRNGIAIRSPLSSVGYPAGLGPIHNRAKLIYRVVYYLCAHQLPGRAYDLNSAWVSPQVVRDRPCSRRDGLLESVVITRRAGYALRPLRSLTPRWAGGLDFDLNDLGLNLLHHHGAVVGLLGDLKRLRDL